jgi:hypothetical protein
MKLHLFVPLLATVELGKWRIEVKAVELAVARLRC